MSNEKALTRVQLTSSMLQSATGIKGVLEIEAVAQNWVDTYQKVTGRTDGLMKFEAEKILFMQEVMNNKSLEKCDKFTIYASFIELACSGLTLRDGISYIIPYKDKAQFQVGWKGRLEQMSQMPNTIHVSEPICIYSDEQYEIIGGERLRIVHMPKIVHEEGAQIIAVYMTVLMEHGKEFYYMTRDEVLAIRDQYSQSYKSYVAALAKPVNKGKKPGDKLTIEYMKNGEKQTFESDDVPMWVSSEASAFKKTLVKRVYNQLPKLPFMKYLDEKIMERIRQTNVDVDEMRDPHKSEPEGPTPEEILAAAMPVDDGGQPATIAEAEVIPDPPAPIVEEKKPGAIPSNPAFQGSAATVVASGGTGKAETAKRPAAPRKTVPAAEPESAPAPEPPAPTAETTGEIDLLAGLG